MMSGPARRSLHGVPLVVSVLVPFSAHKFRRKLAHTFQKKSPVSPEAGLNLKQKSGSWHTLSRRDWRGNLLFGAAPFLYPCLPSKRTHCF